MPGKTGWETLPEPRRLPAGSQLHQRAGSQGRDGLQQPHDLLVSTSTGRKMFVESRAVSTIILNWNILSVLFLSICSLLSPPPAKKKRKQTTTILGCWLPWWFVFVGWVMLLSISGISTFFTLLYGFQYGKEKSIKWVMSLGLSLFQSIFILQPLKVGNVSFDLQCTADVCILRFLTFPIMSLFLFS